MSRKYSRRKAVAERYGVHPTTVWRWENDPRFAYLEFPKSIPIGPNVAAFADDELDAYDARRAGSTHSAS